MAKEYICPICGKKFEFKEGDIHLKNRYYHRKCYEAKEAIHERCKQMFGVNYSKNKIEKQIKNIMNEGKSITGINYTLFYWYDVKGNSPDKANYGINIVSYVYGEALDYCLKQKELSNLNKNIKVDDIINPITEEYNISKRKRKRPLRVKLFDLD